MKLREIADKSLARRLRKTLCPMRTSRLLASSTWTIAALSASTLDANAQKSSSKLETCSKPVGTLAVLEPEDWMLVTLKEYGLTSPTQLIRMMVQRTNCYQVVERGAALSAMARERELAQAGGLQKGSNVGKGQMKAADFIMTPTIEISNPDAGGIGGLVGGLLGRRSPIAGAVLGGLKFKQAQTSILITDTRSGVQVASAEGKATKRDFAIGVAGIGGASFGASGGYTNTDEGKVIAASFLDNLNKIVRGLRGDAVAEPSEGAAPRVKAEAPLNEGDILRPKLDNVRVLAEPRDGSRVMGSLKKSDEVVFLGAESNGFLHVEGNSAMGWVKKTLVASR